MTVWIVVRQQAMSMPNQLLKCLLTRLSFKSIFRYDLSGMKWFSSRMNHNAIIFIDGIICFRASSQTDIIKIIANVVKKFYGIIGMRCPCKLETLHFSIEFGIVPKIFFMFSSFWLCLMSPTIFRISCSNYLLLLSPGSHRLKRNSTTLELFAFTVKCHKFERLMQSSQLNNLWE